MLMAKLADDYKGMNLAVLARAHYLSVVLARDTRSITPDKEPSEVACYIGPLKAIDTSGFLNGNQVFNRELLNEAHDEA
jgi:hypothetical protein